MSVKRRVLVIGGMLLAISGLAIAQQPVLSTQQPADLGIAMRAKLACSQKIVEGLTSGNFEMIQKGAEDLQSICESRVWRPREDQVYTHYRSELQRSAVKLMAMAEQQNLDGASYTYMHTLTTCINCHQYSRDVLRVAVIPRGSAAVVSIPVTEQPSVRRSR
jgi:hypothetical protein